MNDANPWDIIEGAPKPEDITDLGNGFKIAFDEDGDAQWFHMATAHKPNWQALAIFDYHKPTTGGKDDIDELTIPMPVSCSVPGCGIWGFIKDGKFEEVK